MRKISLFTFIPFLCTFINPVYAQLFNNHQIIVDGTFSSIGISEIAGADFDMDGDEDIVACSFNRNEVIWFENLGNNNFTSRKYISQELDGPVSIDVADIDNDGLVDIISASTNASKVVWYKNNGNGEFSAEILVSNEVNYPKKIQALDINNDGNIDIISGSLLNRTLAWHENMGNGTFGSTTVITTDLFDSYFTLGDIDGDGLKDVIYHSTNSNMINWRKRNRVEFSLSQIQLEKPPITVHFIPKI